MSVIGRLDQRLRICSKVATLPENLESDILGKKKSGKIRYFNNFKMFSSKISI